MSNDPLMPWTERKEEREGRDGRKEWMEGKKGWKERRHGRKEGKKGRKGRKKSVYEDLPYPLMCHAWI